MCARSRWAWWAMRRTRAPSPAPCCPPGFRRWSTPSRGVQRRTALLRTSAGLLELARGRNPHPERGGSRSPSGRVRGRRKAARSGAPLAVLLKGGHLAGEPVDVLATASGIEQFAAAADPADARGTGCRLASAMPRDSLAESRPRRGDRRSEARPRVPSGARFQLTRRDGCMLDWSPWEEAQCHAQVRPDPHPGARRLRAVRIHTASSPKSSRWRLPGARWRTSSSAAPT